MQLLEFFRIVFTFERCEIEARWVYIVLKYKVRFSFGDCAIRCMNFLFFYHLAITVYMVHEDLAFLYIPQSKDLIHWSQFTS